MNRPSETVSPEITPGLDFADLDARLTELRRIKNRYTAIKRRAGPRDNDDWGNIPLERSFRFEPESDRSDGLIIGPRLCGLNFRRFLEQTPLYVNPVSSLLGGYFTVFGGYVTRWDEDTAPYDHLKPYHERYNIIHGIQAAHHFGIDLGIGLELGFGGLLEKVRRCRAAHPAPDIEFYEGLEHVLLGIQQWIHRHLAAARVRHESEHDPFRRRNLEELIAMNECLVQAPPRTFREACQWTAWYQMAARVYNGSGAVGRIDHHFLPFFQQDMAAGRLTEEDAILHLACLNLTDPQYYHVSGVDEQGGDATNELSFLVLEAVRRLHVPANVSVGVHPGIDRGLLRKGVTMLFREKLGIPRFFGIENIARGYARNNVPLEVARTRAQVGCHWTCLPGREYSLSDVIKINFAKIFLAAFEDMMADSGTRSVARLWALFTEHLDKAVAVAADGIDLHMEFEHQFAPELVLDLLCHGPVEKGVDASHGALEYNTICVDGAALATTADSFAALEQRVEHEGRLDWDRVADSLARDFEDTPEVQALLSSMPAYGRGGTRGDSWAERISRTFTHLVTRKPTPGGWTMVPGLFSWASTIPMGRVTGATPNGRNAAAPISFGANPDNGIRKGGPVTPTSLSNAVASVQPGFGNAAPMQLDLDPGLVEDERGVHAVEALIRGHFDQGGTLINANVLSKRMIRDAYRHPEKYPDLVVRVTGFSAYFASLSPEFRKLVCDRIVGGADDENDEPLIPVCPTGNMPGPGGEA